MGIAAGRCPVWPFVENGKSPERKEVAQNGRYLMGSETGNQMPVVTEGSGEVEDS